MSKISKVSLLFAGLSLLSMSLIRYLVGEWVPFCWVALFLTVFFSGFAAYWDRQLLGQFLSLKTTKQGMSMGVLILLVVCGLGLLNLLGLKYYTTFDFSINKLNTLSPQSVQVLSRLQDDMQVLLFYKKGVEGNEENRRLFKDLVKRYQDVSAKVKLNFVEVNERPDLAKEFGVDKGSGVVFVSYQGRKNRIEKIEEQELTNAMIKVTLSVTRKVYFVSGHQELDPEDMREGRGLNAFKLLLENNQFEVRDLNFANSGKGVPADADVVVVAGPKQAYQDFEVQYLRDYLRQGGGLFLALESQTPVNLESLIADLGVKFGNNYVVNVVETMLGRGVNQGPTMGTEFQMQSAITKMFKKGEITLFRYPSSLELKSIPALEQTVFVGTGKNSMAFNDLALTKEGPGGPFHLGVQVKGKFGGDKESVAVVVGDADFISNQMLYQNLNRDLALNIVATVARDENAVSITTKEPQVTKMMLTDTKFALFLFGFIIPFPLLFLAMAVGLWVRRRHA